MTKLLSKIHKIYRQPRTWPVLVGLIFLLGLLLRLSPGRDHLIWDYDQARDSYAARNIIANRDLILIGPQAEKFGMFHGPLYYYFIAPFHYLSRGDPNLPQLAMILLNLSVMIPLGLLVQSLFKNKTLTLLSLLMFAVAYEQIEYARWLSNVSMAIPFLIWSYYWLWRLWQGKNVAWWLGLFLGLAIQGELFLLYLIPYCYLILYLAKHKWPEWLKLHLGLAVGVLPLILAELKFNWQSSKLFFSYFIAKHSSESISAATAVLGYLDHLGFVAKNTISGFSNSFGLYSLILLLFVFVWLMNCSTVKKYFNQLKQPIKFILLLLFSHTITFAFHFVDAVFLDLGIGVTLIILTALVLYSLWQAKYRVAALGLLVLSLGLQLKLLCDNTVNHEPFNKYKFVQEAGILFKEKLAVVDTVYQLADGQEFTFAVLGTPYGVRTKWASVFQPYVRRHQQDIPDWYGYYANGYWGDDVFQPTDQVGAQHILLIEPDQHLLGPYISQQYLTDLNKKTTLVESVTVYDHIIQLRQPIN